VTEKVSGAPELWRAALLDAAGVVSAYLAPKEYSLASYEVRGIASGAAEFEAEIAARLDLARVVEVGRLLPRFGEEATKAFRHEVVTSKGYLRGKLHVPRYLRALAQGETSSIPVVRATKQSATPENYFLSEVLRLSSATCASWVARGGAEGRLAGSLARELARTETEAPWSSLRSRPRPSLRELSSIVRGRVVTGAIPKDGVADLLSRQFPPHRIATPTILEETVDALLFLLSNDSRFEDRIFELICLAWLVAGLQAHARDVSIDLKAVKGGGGTPVAKCTIRGWLVEVFFQTATSVTPVGRWKYTHSGAALRGIPDIVLRCQNSASPPERIVFIDAKNRTFASESEVIYKLLGYKENFAISPYLALGAYPSLTRDHRVRELFEGSHRILLLHVPLVSGKRMARRLAHVLLESLA
jgi:hypothetical protein